MHYLDVARLERAECGQHPFAHLVARGMLAVDAQGKLLDAFPRYREAGFFPWQREECKDPINDLIDQLVSHEFASALGARLGIPNLACYPVLVILCRHLNRRHGTIHTDSRSKIATALLYLSPDWPHGSAACLRFLQSIDDIDAVLAPEIAPVYGTLAAFRRTDNSFHGHLPHQGERPVIQVAWLVSEEAKARKTRRGGVTRTVKKLFARLDRKLGAGRDRNAAHKD